MAGTTAFPFPLLTTMIISLFFGDEANGNVIAGSTHDLLAGSERIFVMACWLSAEFTSVSHWAHALTTIDDSVQDIQEANTIFACSCTISFYYKVNFSKFTDQAVFPATGILNDESNNDLNSLYSTAVWIGN